MKEVADILRALAREARNTVTPSTARSLPDDELLKRLRAAEELVRAGDAIRLAMIGEIDDRSRAELGSGRLSAKLGCRNSNELIQRVTQASGATVSKRLRVARSIRPRIDLAGNLLPPELPEVAAAVHDGTVGFDTAHAITAVLEKVSARAGRDAVNAAVAELVAAATGVTAGSGGVPCGFEDTRVHLEVWQALLDPDGEEPSEAVMLRRGLNIGTKAEHGVFRFTGWVLPELAGQLIAIRDAYASPARPVSFEETDDPFDRVKDPRTSPQLLHDTLAAAINTAARVTGTPSLGGAAPTVLVSVNAEDLQTGEGVGFIDHLDGPISMAAVKQFACNGGIQKVVQDGNGAVVALYAKDRGSTSQQRRAVALRDGGCVIPGCGMPAAWAENHHVIDHAEGGPTDVGNLVALCWFHHHTLGTSGWQIRMNHGVPEVKAPRWIGGDGKWHLTTKSRTTVKRAKKREWGTISPPPRRM